MKNSSRQLEELTGEYGIKRLLVEDEISLGTAASIAKATGCETDANGRLSGELSRLRMVKSKKETEMIIQAQCIAEKAFAELLNFIKPGVTEKRLAAELEYRMKLAGADGAAFDTIAVSGKNSSLPHGVPGDREVKAGDFITFDFGAVIGGYHSDMTRTVAVGHADERMKEVYETVLLAMNAGEQAAQPGSRCCEADMAARAVITDAGYGQYFAHSTGHGVGLEIHEAPALSSKSQSVLSPGNVVTCEPGIYLPGKFGVRIEDMLYISENGPENITKFEKQLLII